MIWAAFTSEWTKLRRRTLLLSTFLGLAAAASLFVILMFSQASANGGIVTLHQLARPNGLVIGVARASMLLGVVAFGIAASQVASEYSLGTLRQLLVRQPRRAVLLVGKMLGVITFLVLALCFAGVVAFVVALALDLRVIHRWLEEPVLVVFPLIGVAACAVLYVAIRRRYNLVPFFCGMAIFAAAFATLAVSFYPYMVPFSITIADATSPAASLSFMFWGAGVIVLPITLIYTLVVYFVFKGKVDPDAEYQ